jgi:hypothetical protein
MAHHSTLIPPLLSPHCHSRRVPHRTPGKRDSPAQQSPSSPHIVGRIVLRPIHHLSAPFRGSTVKFIWRTQILGFLHSSGDDCCGGEEQGDGKLPKHREQNCCLILVKILFRSTERSARRLLGGKPCQNFTNSGLGSITEFSSTSSLMGNVRLCSAFPLHLGMIARDDCPLAFLPRKFVLIRTSTQGSQILALQGLLQANRA